MVNFDDSVIVVGGLNKENGYSKSFYKLVCFDDCHWNMMPQKLAVARGLFVAMTIPDEMTNCKAKVRTKV